MSELENAHAAGFTEAWYEAQAELDELRAKLAQAEEGKDTIYAEGYAGGKEEMRAALAQAEERCLAAEAREAALRLELKGYLGSPEDIKTEMTYMESAISTALAQAEAREANKTDWLEMGRIEGRAEAAQVIEQQCAALSAARAELAEWEHSTKVVALVHKEELERLRAEAEAMREELEYIVLHDPDMPGLKFDSWEQLARSMVAGARAVLYRGDDLKPGLNPCKTRAVYEP